MSISRRARLRYFLAEPGFSLWIECGGRKILFDAGYSGIFLRNARLMGIDAAAPDTVVLSHGHSDHTWGLSALISERTARGMKDRPALVCHPGALARKKLRGADAGMIIAPEVLGSFFDLRPSREVMEIAENLYWLGEIEPLVTPRGTLGEAMDEGGEWRPDVLRRLGARLRRRGRPRDNHGLFALGDMQHRRAGETRDEARKDSRRHRRLPSAQRLGRRNAARPLLFREGRAA